MYTTMFRSPSNASAEAAKNTRSGGHTTNNDVKVSVTLSDGPIAKPDMSSTESASSTSSAAHATDEQKQYHDELLVRVNTLTEWIRRNANGPGQIIEAEIAIKASMSAALHTKINLGSELTLDDHSAADFGPSPVASPMPSKPEVANQPAELPGIVCTDDVGTSPKSTAATLARQVSAGSNLNSIIDTTSRKPHSEDHLSANAQGMAGHGGPQLPPGHFVSQVAASPRPAQRIRRTSSMPLDPEVDQEEDEVSMVTPKKDAVRVSLEGVAQLGQLLCRMMLFPIFRSNNEYLHWKKIFRTIVRIRLPDDCRRKVWTIVARRTIPPSACKTLLDSVADHDIMDLCVQIEKDLHRTSDNVYFQSTTGRATLARVLLAYSQHNKEVGYCQSLNFIGAHLLLLMNKNEEDAFAALCVLVDQLPKNYFDDLEALAVDLLVFDELMKERLPRLHAHCRRLMKQDAVTYNYTVLDADDEPPLTSVFTGQWFPTLFANLLPQDILFRVWDAILFDGDEMMFRVALAIITMLEPQLLSTKNSLQFYEQLKEHTHDFGLVNVINCDDMIKLAYNLYPFPLPRLAELRASMSKKRSAAKAKATAKPEAEKAERATSPGFFRRLSLKLDSTLDTMVQDSPKKTAKTAQDTDDKNGMVTEASTESIKSTPAVPSQAAETSSQEPAHDHTISNEDPTPDTPTKTEPKTEAKTDDKGHATEVESESASTEKESQALRKNESTESAKSTESTKSTQSTGKAGANSHRSAQGPRGEHTSECSNIS